MTVTVDGERWFEGKASCVLVGNLGTIIGGISAFDDAVRTTAGSRSAWSPRPDRGSGPGSWPAWPSAGRTSRRS